MESGEVYKVFDGGTNEAAKFFQKSPTVIYNHCSRPREFFNYFGFNLRFESKLREKIDVKKESEDEIRRRLGLNPYGEWRTDEWIYAMVERVNAEVEKDKHKYYDPYNKAYERRKKRDIQGEWFDPKIDTRGYML